MCFGGDSGIIDKGEPFYIQGAGVLGGLRVAVGKDKVQI
jgi:hypothetical protein